MLTNHLRKTNTDIQNPLLAAANANRNPNDDDTLSDYVPESRDISVSRAVRFASGLSHVYYRSSECSNNIAIGSSCR